MSWLPYAPMLAQVMPSDREDQSRKCAMKFPKLFRFMVHSPPYKNSFGMNLKLL